MEAPELVGLPRIAYIGVLAKDPSDELNYNVRSASTWGRYPPVLRPRRLVFIRILTCMIEIAAAGRRQLEVRRPLEVFLIN